MADEPQRAAEETPAEEAATEEASEAREAADAAERVLRRHPLVRGFVLGAILTAAMAAFIVQNTQSVSFEWLWLDFGARLWLALLVAFGIGLVIGLVVAAIWRRAYAQRSRQRRLLRRWTRPDKASAEPVASGDS